MQIISRGVRIMEEMTYHKEGDYLIPNMKPEPLADELRIW